MEPPHNRFDENNLTGWIKIYRSIEKHWVFDDSLYFKAWCIILMEVNHKDKKIAIGKRLFECKRGQAIFSLESWREKLGKEWSKQKIRTFFKL